ncbi:hypothetical protein N7468_004401 [Penicillium chermesinum]|uniref:Cell division control protein n=1 Tax=Penicillium chermesinum TaxID=63820 RepID=A0A9W9TSQ7_9EURO|nr:uncharacterized protein N7468_004401 [Penicillium chermesinum]KAJ5239782.1 hypothetical protein N7468_004401 [Penicillium chermesinum]
MPGTVADGPSVSMSCKRTTLSIEITPNSGLVANNFWGSHDAGLQPMLDRMHGSKTTNDELKAFYSVRAAIEDEYARKLQALCRKPLGTAETGSLRLSLDTVRGETEAIAKAHLAIAGQMKSELEEPLAAFASGLKERRKIIQNGIERLHKIKVQQTQVVNKTRDRFEQDCLRIKGYLAQGHMVMGQEERKNKAKLEKTQIQRAANSQEYEAAVKTLEETTGRWNKEWKSACDKFQDLEEERIDFTKSSLWTYANIASTVCVSDDASCEKIRLALEECEVEKDIVFFIKHHGTGQEIPDPPRFINFSKEDADDDSDMDGGEGYSPSTFESHHDPQSDLAAQMGHPAPAQASAPAPVAAPAPMPAPGAAPAPAAAPPAMPAAAPAPVPMQNHAQHPAPLDLRRGGYLPPNYDPEQHGEINKVPHNAYPTDGMTMFCRAGPPSDRSSALSQYRPSSRDSASDVSNPASMSSVEPPGPTQAPVAAKQAPPQPGPMSNVPVPVSQEDKQVSPKKKTAFFSNSPFRRKSRHDKDRPAIGNQSPSRSPWNSPSKHTSPTKASAPGTQPDRAVSPEPVDPRANFQLNVGNNVFDVASPEKKDPKSASQGSKGDGDDVDPIARALADLKTSGKQASVRVSADRYHGIHSPTPSAQSSAYGGSSAAAPPAYNDPSAKRLDAPEPAFTAKQMQKTTQRYTGQTQSMLRGNQNPAPMAQEVPRARSPVPRRSASPQVSSRVDSPATASPQRLVVRKNPLIPPNDYAQRTSPAATHRAVSPQPQFRQQARPSSAGGMELQLSGGPDMYGGSQYGSSPRRDGRPMSHYGDGGSVGGGSGGGGPPIGRSRSRTLAVAEPGRRFSRDGRPILHFARAMYSYSAAIPEELGFTKGDVLAVIRLQDDGWWEAEVTNSRGHPGLVPSNYLQII